MLCAWSARRKKNIIKISISRGGSRAGSRAASPRIGTQVETEPAPAQVRKPTNDEACVDRLVSRVVGDALWAVTGQSVCSCWSRTLVLQLSRRLTQEAAPESQPEAAAAQSAEAEVQEAAAPKAAGWRWGRAMFAVAIGVIALGIVVAAHRGHRQSARK